MTTSTHTSLSESLHRQMRRIARQVGHTPLYELRNVFHKPGVRLFAKLEWQQLSGSVKARAGWRILSTAIRSGQLDGQRRLLDATSGNTGIAYATFAAALGVPVTLCMPENASEARKRILRSLGAELILTSRLEGTDGAQQYAAALAAERPDLYYHANQYANDANWQAHYHSTALEIWEQTKGQVTHFVAGLGTSGTITGTGRRLRALKPEIEIVALQPDTPMHGLEGWKHMATAIVPRIYDPSVHDRIVEVNTLEALEMVRRAAREEGLLIGPSSGANLAGAIKVAEQLDEGVVVTTFADTADKYAEVMTEIFG